MNLKPNAGPNHSNAFGSSGLPRFSPKVRRQVRDRTCPTLPSPSSPSLSWATPIITQPPDAKIPLHLHAYASNDPTHAIRPSIQCHPCLSSLKPSDQPSSPTANSPQPMSTLCHHPKRIGDHRTSSLTRDSKQRAAGPFPSRRTTPSPPSGGREDKIPGRVCSQHHAGLPHAELRYRRVRDRRAFYPLFSSLVNTVTILAVTTSCPYTLARDSIGDSMGHVSRHCPYP